MSMTTLENSSGGPPPTHNMDGWLRLTTIWHLLLSLGAVGLAGYLWVGAAELALWLKIVLTIVALAYAGASAYSTLLFPSRHHRGRVISLAVNYIGFLICLLGSLHFLGIFLAVDALADTFARGLIFLATAFVGYLVSNFGDRFEGAPQEKQLKTAGRWIAILSFVAFLFAVGILGGIWATLQQLDDLLTVSLVAGLAVFALFVWVMWRQPAADAFGATNKDTEMLEGYLFLSPNLIGFLIFFAGPLILSLYFSFTNADAFGTADWVGLSNYREILGLDLAQLATADQLSREVIDVTTYTELSRFSLFGNHYVIGARDNLFWISLWNTIKFVLMAVPLSVIPALFLANLLNSKLPGMRFFRAVYFLPSVAAVVGIALVWQWLFNSTIGYINYAITLSVEFLNSLGGSFTDPMVRWLSSSDTALIAVVILMAWRLIGFNTVLFLAGLQNIPKSLYEAATVDGAGPWQQFLNVTIPMLTPTTFFVVITTLITTFQVFEDVFILMGTNPQGPNNSTLVMVLYLYQKGFQRFEQGYASAIAWVLFLIIFVATLIQVRRQNSGMNYEG